MSPSAGLARRLASNTAYAAAGRVASIFVWVLLTPMLLRGLGSEGYAIWALFFALTGYFGALDFGLSQATLKHVAAARAREEEGAGGAFATLAVLGYLILSGLWLLLTALFRDPLLDWLRVSPEARTAAAHVMVLGAPVFACSGLANVAMAVLQGCGRFDLAALVLLVVVGWQAIGVPIVLNAHLGIPGLAINVGMAWMLGALLGFGLFRRADPRFRWETPRASLTHLREALRFGGPMQVTNLFGVLNLQLDKFLLPRFVGLTAVTPYELGFRVIIAAATIPQVLVAALLPAAAAIHASGLPARLRELYERTNRYVLVVAAGTMAAILGSGSRLYAAWLGPGHSDAALALRGLALASTASIGSVAAVIIARSVSRTDLEAWFSAITFAVHLLLSVILIPKYGIMGALIAVVIANVIGSAILLLITSRALGWPSARIMLEPLGVPMVALGLGSAASLAVDRLFPTGQGLSMWVWLGAVAAIGVIVAFGTALVTRFIRVTEVRSILGVSPARPD